MIARGFCQNLNCMKPCGKHWLCKECTEKLDVEKDKFALEVWEGYLRSLEVK